MQDPLRYEVGHWHHGWAGLRTCNSLWPAFADATLDMSVFKSMQSNEEYHQYFTLSSKHIPFPPYP